MKRRCSHIICIIILCSSVIACSKKQVSPEAYMNYVNNKENGLLKSEEIGEYELQIQYRPVEYNTLVELGYDQATKETFDELVQQHKGEQCVLLRIGSKDRKTDAMSIGIADQQQYNDRISYLISQINKDVFLVDGNDTLPCSMHHFERSYHLTHYHTIIFTFENPKVKDDDGEDKILVYNDDILGIGKVNIHFDQKDIQHIPTIVF